MASAGRKRRPDKASDAAPIPKCKYGKQCYRRDENHFQQYLHPEGSLNRSPEGCSTLDQEKDQPSKTKPPQALFTSGVVHGKLPTNPYSVFFNKVEGIEECFNETCLSIKDILNSRGRKLIRSAQFTYMVDIPWLVDQYPETERSKPLLIVQGFTGKNKAPLLAEASQFGNVVLCEPKLPYPFGTHHTKMMLLLYEEGLKVVVTTSNLVETDWTKKTQSIWMSPVFPKRGAALPPKEDPGTNFGEDLVDYLATYKLPSVDEWIEVINGHDLSGARVYLVASVPGRYKTTDGRGGVEYGHLRLRRLLQKECSSYTVDKSWGVVCQMSSIGSLGSTPETWLTGEFVDSLSGCDGGPSRPDYLKLVYPSVENIRNSLEGYMAGSSFPYSQRVSNGQPYLRRFLHRWKFDTRGRSRAMPHLKSYFRTSKDAKDVAWYLLTSANLSKAAWGCYELKKTQFFVRSYELGVLFVPRLYNDSSTSKGVLSNFPVSLDLPLEVYGPQDKPWIYDVNYTEHADSHGRIWKIN